MGWLSKLFGSESVEPGIGRQGIGRGWDRVGEQFMAIRCPSEPSFDLVGEQQWQDNIADVIGGKRYEGGVYWQVLGQICFDENNLADPNAVVALIDGKPVGWVPRADCKSFRAQIMAQNPDAKPVICKAMIHGGFRRRDGTWASYGVRIGVTDPIQLVGCKAPV